VEEPTSKRKKLEQKAATPAPESRGKNLTRSLKESRESSPAVSAVMANPSKRVRPAKKSRTEASSDNSGILEVHSPDSDSSSSTTKSQDSETRNVTEQDTTLEEENLDQDEHVKLSKSSSVEFLIKMDVEETWSATDLTLGEKKIDNKDADEVESDHETMTEDNSTYTASEADSNVNDFTHIKTKTADINANVKMDDINAVRTRTADSNVNARTADALIVEPTQIKTKTAAEELLTLADRSQQLAEVTVHADHQSWRTDVSDMSQHYLKTPEKSADYLFAANKVVGKLASTKTASPPAMKSLNLLMIPRSCNLAESRKNLAHLPTRADKPILLSPDVSARKDKPILLSPDISARKDKPILLSPDILARKDKPILLGPCVSRNKDMLLKTPLSKAPFKNSGNVSPFARRVLNSALLRATIANNSIPQSEQHGYSNIKVAQEMQSKPNGEMSKNKILLKHKTKEFPYASSHTPFGIRKPTKNKTSVKHKTVKSLYLSTYALKVFNSSSQRPSRKQGKLKLAAHSEMEISGSPKFNESMSSKKFQIKRNADKLTNCLSPYALKVFNSAINTPSKKLQEYNLPSGNEEMDPGNQGNTLGNCEKQLKHDKPKFVLNSLSSTSSSKPKDFDLVTEKENMKNNNQCNSNILDQQLNNDQSKFVGLVKQAVEECLKKFKLEIMAELDSRNL
jgi:hypothetical protein